MRLVPGDVWKVIKDGGDFISYYKVNDAGRLESLGDRRLVICSLLDSNLSAAPDGTTHLEACGRCVVTKQRRKFR